MNTLNTFPNTEEEVLNIHKTIKYKQLKIILENLFNEKGYSPGSKFNSSVWFIKDYSNLFKNNPKEELIEKHKEHIKERHCKRDTFTSKIIEEKLFKKEIEDIEYIKSYFMMEIFEKIPFSKDFLYEKENFRNEFSFQSMLNMKKIKSDEERKAFKIIKDIYVCDYIRSICEILVFSNIHLKKHEEILYKLNNNIESYKVDLIKNISLYENKEKDCVLKLNESKLNKVVYKQLLNEFENHNNGISFLNLKIISITNFPIGIYKFKLILKEIDSDFNVVSHIRQSQGNLIVEVNEPNQTLNVSNFNIQYNNIFLKGVDQSSLISYMRKNDIKEKIILIKNEINDTFTSRNNKRSLTNNSHSIEKRMKKHLKNRISEKNSNNLYNDIVLTKRQVIDETQPNHISSFKMKKKNKSYLFTNNNQNNKNDEVLPSFTTKTTFLPFNISFQMNSGTNLLNLELCIDGKDKNFGIVQLSFLDILFSLINQIKDYEKTKFTYVLSIKIDLNEIFYSEASLYNNCYITIDLRLLLKNNIKKAILKRLNQYIEYEKILISHYQEIITNIISYFPDISQEINHFLKDNCKNDDGECCNDCIIY